MYSAGKIEAKFHVEPIEAKFHVEPPSGFSGTPDSASLDAKNVRRTHKNAKSRVRRTLFFFPRGTTEIITNLSLNFAACHW